MARNRFCVPGLRVLPKGVLFALAPNDAAVSPKSGVARCRVSSDDNEFLLGLRRKRPQRLLPAVFKNEGNCLSEVVEALFACLAMPIRTWNFTSPPKADRT